ncbi:hypothetical protein T8K17_13335 [Thalassobaculum sp. OXR-137]|uniref:hypothetical protein n=1 Tax=Thalassobaculum sp. OXR-137 TaxID=3100173 RepID=UPI002AC901A1|nr:hypothetical protein [Thalassobaculum sp. OXR-137]WPZ32225.1 hypothetical protein T8K17_13335 [Thalassobaculum sp. OXR-137]
MTANNPFAAAKTAADRPFSASVREYVEAHLKALNKLAAALPATDDGLPLEEGLDLLEAVKGYSTTAEPLGQRLTRSIEATTKRFDKATDLGQRV